MGRSRRNGMIGALAALALTLGACGDDTPGTTATNVDVRLQEFAVIANPKTAPAGPVSFRVRNMGPNDVHEFVVVRTDLAPDALPLGADGGVSETGAGLTAVGEIEDVAVGAAETVTFTLTAGAYVLLCNIVDAAETPPEVHYKLGMRSGFTVT